MEETGDTGGWTAFKRGSPGPGSADQVPAFEAGLDAALRIVEEVSPQNMAGELMLTSLDGVRRIVSVLQMEIDESGPHTGIDRMGDIVLGAMIAGWRPLTYGDAGGYAPHPDDSPGVAEMKRLMREFADAEVPSPVATVAQFLGSRLDQYDTILAHTAEVEREGVIRLGYFALGLFAAGYRPPLTMDEQFRREMDGEAG